MKEQRTCKVGPDLGHAIVGAESEAIEELKVYFTTCSLSKPRAFRNVGRLIQLAWVSEYPWRMKRRALLHHSTAAHQRWKPVGSTGRLGYRSGRDSSTGRSNRLKQRSNSPFLQLKDILSTHQNMHYYILL